MQLPNGPSNGQFCCWMIVCLYEVTALQRAGFPRVPAFDVTMTYGEALEAIGGFPGENEL